MYNNFDYQHKSRPSFSIDSNSRESLYSGYENQWNENSRDHRRDQIRNRDRGNGDRDYRDRERSLYVKRDRSNSRDGNDKLTRDEQVVSQPIQQSFPTFNYNATDQSFVDSSKRILSMLPAYNMVAQLNNPWNVSSIDGMPVTQNNVPVNNGSTHPVQNSTIPVQNSTIPHQNSTIPVQNSTIPVSPALDMVQPSNSIINPPTFITGMYAGVGIGNTSQYDAVAPQENKGPVKEIIKLTKSVLYPPKSNDKRPTIEKPDGCKTVFVNYLPEKATEEIMREIFERCGSIDRISLSKRNFCHIRFSDELSVENAICLSGYRLNIDYKDETPYSSILHVDYSPSRDDLYDYKCKLRALERKARHEGKDSSKSNQSKPKKSLFGHFNDHEASLVCEKLKNDETFSEGASMLITWLEKGECTKRTSGTFFSMIQSTHTHVRKLEVEKVKYEEQLNEAKNKLKKQLEGIIRQFTEVGKIYAAALLQKNWDHFTKPQRKYIEMWKKQTEELKNTHVDEVVNEREDEEMEVSDDDNDSSKKEDDVDQLKKQYEERIKKLQEINDSLKCKLEASQSEMMTMQSNHQDELEKNNKQLKAVQTALQHSIQEKLNQCQKYPNDGLEAKELNIKVEKNENNDLSYDCNDTGEGLSTINIENDAHIVGLISAFLNIHHFGANLDYICAYLHENDCSVNVREVESLMKRFPTLFKEESSGVGANLQKKWRFVRFQTVDRSTMCDF